MFVHVVYGSESGDRIVKCVSTTTAADVLQNVAHGCTLYLYNKHNGRELPIVCCEEETFVIYYLKIHMILKILRFYSAGE